MTKLEQHRKTWQGKSDEWLFERLANELTQKVEEIHKLIAENEQLRLYNVSNRRELLIAFFNHIHVEKIVKDVPMKIEPIVDEWLKSNYCC